MDNTAKPYLEPEASVSLLRQTFREVVASAIGAACCVYTGQPFDTVKVRMQLVTGGASKIKIGSILSETVQQGGFQALWRGSTPALTGQLLENTVAFAINGVLKRLIFESEDPLHTSYAQPIVTGSITGLFASIVLCPCDTIKCRAQANIANGVKSNVMQIAKDVVKRDGVLGLWKSPAAQVLRDIPFYGSFFGSYDILCHVLKQSTSWSDGTVFFVSGGLAGQIGWLCSIIPDTLKSRLQVSDDRSLTLGRVFREIVSSQGWRGLFTGIEVALIRAFPANAALFVGYEYSKRFLNNL